MAKRASLDIRRSKSRSRKTKKRLAVKAAKRATRKVVKKKGGQRK